MFKEEHVFQLGLLITFVTQSTPNYGSKNDNLCDSQLLSIGNYSLSSGGGCALIVESMDPRGFTKGALIVSRGYKMYIRFG